MLSQGAEAKIYLVDFLGEAAILKQRLPKSYRHPILDKRLTQERIRNESKILAKARKLGVNVPYILKVNEDSIIMMYIQGEKLKDYLQKDTQILRDVAIGIAKLHNGNIIHGDLTTSNIIVKDKKPFFIDFGLSYVKQGYVEDYAVDLYVLEKAFLSTHPGLEQDFENLLAVYKEHQQQGQKVLDKLEQVRQRGRKKLAFG